MIRDLSTTLALLSDPSLAAPFPELHHALIAFDRCVDSARAKGGKVDSVRLAGGWADHQVGLAPLEVRPHAVLTPEGLPSGPFGHTGAANRIQNFRQAIPALRAGSMSRGFE